MDPRVRRRIKDYWEERAAWAVPEAQVTHADIWQRWLELELLDRELARLGRPGRVLEVGCGTGYAARRLAGRAREYLATDFSSAMIERARREDQAGPANLAFRLLDVLALDEAGLGAFDVILSVRCLINLGDWASQRRALRGFHAHLAPAGRLILVEGLADGRRRLNQARLAAGLPAMKEVWYNRDLEARELRPFLGRYFRVEREFHFGTYDFLSRVYHPLVVAPQEPTYDSPFNKVAAELALTQDGYRELSRIIGLVLIKR